MGGWTSNRARWLWWNLSWWVKWLRHFICHHFFFKIFVMWHRFGTCHHNCNTAYITIVTIQFHCRKTFTFSSCCCRFKKDIIKVFTGQNINKVRLMNLLTEKGNGVNQFVKFNPRLCIEISWCIADRMKIQFEPLATYYLNGKSWTWDCRKRRNTPQFEKKGRKKDKDWQTKIPNRTGAKKRERCSLLSTMLWQPAVNRGRLVIEDCTK